MRQGETRHGRGAARGRPRAGRRRARVFGLIMLSVCAALPPAGCAVIDLSPFSVSTYPRESEEIIGEVPAVWVEFSEAVDKDAAESILSVTAEGKSVEGDRQWEGDRLSFTPVKPFSRGMRHELRLDGTVRTTGGRYFRELIVVTFYVGTDARPPIITGIVPEEGGTCGVTAPLRFTFSRPMDAETFTDAFSLSPTTEHRVEWNAEYTQAAITPEDRWDRGTPVTWSITTACASADGVAVGRAWTGTFLAQEDATPPRVVDTGPAAVEGADVLPLPGGLSDILFGDSLRIVFSEEVDPDSLTDAFSLSPSLDGTLRRVSSDVFVFVPAEDWNMGQEYVCVVSTDLLDARGNPMRSPHREVFTTAIPVQGVEEISLGGDLDEAPAYPASQMNNAVPHLIDWLPSSEVGIGDLRLSLTIRFSRGYDDGLKPVMADAVELAGYYPDVMNPRIVQADWLDSRTLVVSCTGFSYSEASPSLERLYYMLRVSSGASRTMNQEGSYLEDDVTLLLESGPDS